MFTRTLTSVLMASYYTYGAFTAFICNYVYVNFNFYINYLYFCGDGGYGAI